MPPSERGGQEDGHTRNSSGLSQGFQMTHTWCNCLNPSLVLRGYAESGPCYISMHTMKLVLGSALYPPDIATPGVYMKELAERLAKNHEISVVVYGHLPEPTSGASISVVSKRANILARLLSYGLTLRRTCRGAEALYIQNGASVELPALVISLLSGVPFILHVGDMGAHARAGRGFIFSLIERLARRRARFIVSPFEQGLRGAPGQVVSIADPLTRPEVLPFAPRPEQSFAKYEASWEEHIRALSILFTRLHEKN